MAGVLGGYSRAGKGGIQGEELFVGDVGRVGGKNGCREAGGLTLPTPVNGLSPRNGGRDGLPPEARNRLEELGTGDGTTGLFTSDLSVNEFVLIRECGFQPRGLVLGSSIYNMGVQLRPWWANEELATFSQAMYAARELAMERMEEESRLLGADGVVGVRLDVNFYDWGRHSAEFIAIGTAVSADDRESWAPHTGNRPFTSDLSGQDFWTLLRAGYAPMGLVMGTCVYHVGRRALSQTVYQAGRSVELSKSTQALYEARELAMARMQDEAERLGAAGIVGVQLLQQSHFWGSHVIEFLAIGTAVRPLGAVANVEPGLVMTLDR